MSNDSYASYSCRRLRSCVLNIGQDRLDAIFGVPEKSSMYQYVFVEVYVLVGIVFQ